MELSVGLMMELLKVMLVLEDMEILNKRCVRKIRLKKKLKMM
jgi:hypothetical protein